MFNIVMTLVTFGILIIPVTVISIRVYAHIRDAYSSSKQFNKLLNDMDIEYASVTRAAVPQCNALKIQEATSKHDTYAFDIASMGITSAMFISTIQQCTQMIHGPIMMHNTAKPKKS